MTRIADATFAEAAYAPSEISEAYLAANNLTRAQWEAMVAKELAKMNPQPPPSQ